MQSTEPRRRGGALVSRFTKTPDTNMTWNLARSIPAGCRSRAPRTNWLLATPFGLIVLLAFAFFAAPRSAHGAEASLLSYGDFEPDQATTVVEMPNTYIVGTHATGIWSTRLGTGSQQVAFLDDGAGNHHVSVGTSPNQPGIFQVVPWPGEGTAQLSYAYSGPRAVVRIFGAETGDTIAKFSSENSLTLIQQIDNPAATDWTTVTHDVELSGVYDYLVVRFGTASTGASLYDEITMTPPVPAPDTAPVIVTESLPATQIGAAYVATLVAEGGNGALTWSVVEGTLPEGLSLSAEGVISGVSTTAGTSTFTVRVGDDDTNEDPSDEGTREFSIVVSVPVPPSVSIVTTRTSGVAPLAISFDASATTSLATDRPFHDLHYHWNYGDPGSGVWATSRKSKNEDSSPIGGHVYETPGVYTATLTVTDATGASSQATVEITVEDPDVVFAGTNTICISTDGDFTGAPAGAAQVTSNNWSTIASSLGTGKRVLLKRGNTWVFDGNRINMNFAGPGILGAFGTGPKPVITYAADGTGWMFFMGNGNTPYQFGDFRFMDFEIQGRGYNYSGFHGEGAFNNVTILRVDASEMGVFMNLSPAILRYYNNDNRPGHQLWEGIAVVETKFEKVVGDGGEFNGRHIAYIGMGRSLFMGNIWNDSERGEHVLRVPFAQRLTIAHNQLTNSRAAKHLIKLHGGDVSDIPGQPVPPGENQTKLITISDNYFSSRLGDWFVSVGPQNNSSAEVTLDVIVERNEVVFGGDSNIAFHMASSSSTVRNNTVIMTGATGSGTIATIDRRGIEPPPANNQVYNNSGYSGNDQSFTLVSVVASATNTVVRNNLGRSLGASKTLVNGGGTNLVASNNVITDTPGWVVADPTAAHHFDLVSGSPAIGAGYPVPLLADFEGEPRQPSAGISLGAFESPPNTADVAPAIATTTLRNGAYGEPYWVVLEGEGGNGRLHWTIVSGDLPEGLELRANGQIIGKPTTSGSFTFTVRVEDSDGVIGGSDAAEKTFALEVEAEPNSVPRITSTDVPAAVVGTSYTRTLTAIDGNGALTWTLASGALPPGFDLSPEGVISGTATDAGEYEFTVSVADSDDVVGAADEDTATYTLVVNPAGSVTGYQGSTFYNQSFAAQTGQFEATFDVYVPTKPINAPIGLSFGPATSYAQMAAIIGFSAEGYLNARDGGAYTYTAPAIDYEAGMTLGYRLVVDIPAKKYSVYVSVDGGEEQLLADNFDFRTEQASVAALDNLSVKVDAPVGGWISVTNFAVTPIGGPGVPVTGVSLTPASVGLEIGETAMLTATVAPANASNPVVSWSSSAPTVASVDQNGVVTAIGAGSATITATTEDGGFTASSAVTVTAAGQQGLEVSIYSDTATADLGVPSVGASDTTIFRSGTASWRITYADEWSVSIFHPQGAESTMADLTPYANNGYFELWYRSSQAGSVQLRVLDAGAGNANLFQADIPLVATEVWTRVQIPFTGWTQAPSSSASWRLMLRGWGGIGGGTVHYDDIKFIGEEPVTAPVTGVSVAPTSLALEVGQSSTLTATVTPANANPAVSWSTDNAGVATVSSSGVVTAVGLGSATITATTEDGGFTATSAVTVAPAQTNELELAIFSDAATHAYGGVTGVLDTEIRRSGTASWRITYADDWSTSAFNPLGATMGPAAITPYANSGYFEFWYRSSKAGTIRFQVLDVGNVNAALLTIDRAVAATTEWTRIEIPFTGWDLAPSSNTNWRLMLRGYGAMTGATVHYDDIRFVVPSAAGEVPALGVSVSPAATSLEVGQTQQLTATVAPPNATNQDVTWTSSDPSVASVGESGLVTAIAVGTTTITVTTDDGGHTAESTITVVEAQPGRHPFLFFSAKDIPTIRARMDAPEVADRRTRLINRANALLSQAPNTDSRWMQGNSGILAFAYIATGNEAYAQRAIQEALATAALPVWINGDDFNRGADLVSSERSLGTALVYDWCYDVMTPEQRTTLRNALLEKGIAQYLATVDPSLPPNWYTFEPVNNWRGVCHGGNAVAALVLYHESEDARRAAELANQHLPPTIRSLVLEDSGGHEGVTYNNYGVDYALKGALAMQRFYGGYEAVLEEMAVEKLGSYWSVYMFGPDHHFANISRHNYDWAAGYYPDGDVEGGPMSQRATLVDSLVPGGDQLMRWAADNGSQRFYWSAASPFYFLWRRIGAPTTFQQPMPELQDAVLFRGAGHGIFQSDTLWMAYSGGATHNRGDGGAFVLVAKDGENWERLIHLEPSLNHFESENQSTYLINGVGQRRGLDTLINRAQYERFGSGAGFHYAASNIKPLYANPALTKLTRHVVMVRGKYVVMLDDLAGSESLNFEARFQTTQANTITVSADGGKVGGQNLDLHIVSSGFDPFTTGQGQGSSTAVRHLRFSRQAEEAALLTVLYPTAKGGAAPTVQVNNGVVTITHGDETDEVAFIREGQDWRLSAVNGATADNIPTGAERNIVPYREGRDDAEVPVWMVEVVGDPVIVPDTGVTVSHPQVSLNVGQTQAITATVTPANATNGSVVWTTSNPAIVSVTQTSLSAATVRAVGPGSATITATSSGGFTAQTIVNVTSNAELVVPYASTAPALDGVIDSSYSGVLGVIAKPAPDAPVPPPANISASWRAAFTQTDLHIVVDVTDDVWGVGAVDVWHNDSVELFLDGNNSKTAGSDNIDDVKFTFMPQTDGTVFLLLNGYPPNPPGKDYSGVQAAMTVKSDGASDYLGYVLEIKVPLAVLNITPQEGWKLGVDFQINDSDTPGTRDQYVTWFGSNLNNNPVSYGTVSLGQMSGGGTGGPVTGVSVSPDTVELAVGETAALTAVITPSDADDTSVTWSSDTTSVATVDATGVVTAVAPGTATITVTTTDGGFTASSTITVVAAGNSVPTITTVALPAGTVGAAYSQTLVATGGDGALVWSLASGTLPAGLDLSADGAISGAPSAVGTSSFTVRVADSDDVTGASDEDTQELSITIHAESGSEDFAITEQPKTTTVVVGSPITFSVTAPGATTYQWRKNNVNIDGANSDTFSIASATFDDTATYDVVVSDGSESLTSVAVTAVVRALPFDAQGWTILTPSADSLVVYVSSSEGNDSNDGLTPATPKATITAGNALLRDGYPDHLLLKRGDTFVSNTASTLGAWKSGRSATEPIVISYYGDSGARPIIKIANKFIDHDGAVRNYQAFIGIDIYKSNSDPASPDFANVGSQDAMRFVGGGANILVEDCRLRFAGIVVQTLGGTPYTNFRIARTIITDTWVHNSYTQGDAARVSGLFISGTFGYVLEENVFDHNGWNEVVPNAGANQFNHNVYIQYSNGAGAVIRGNISTRASAHGMQVRSGGVVEGNLFSHNAIGFNFGGVQTPTEPAVQTYPNRGLYNVVLNGRLMDTVDNSQPNRTQAVYGITADYMPDILIQENIIANRIASGSNAAFIGTDKMVRVDNIVRQWDPTYDSSDPTWPHPDADIGDYFSTLGGTDSVTDYIHWLRERPLRQLRWDQTAYAAINYIREGFNRGPIDGYYDYDGLSTEDVAPVIVTETISGGVPDVPYEFAFQAIGGNGSLVWTQVAGALPPGLSLSPVGLITGTPTAEGSYSLTVEVRDTDANTSPGDADVAEFILEIAYPPNSVPEITSTWVRSSLVNQAYTHTLQATGGEGDLVWTLIGGALPPGIDLSPAGVLSGTATTVGSYTFTVRVADSDDVTGPEDEAEQVLVFNVYPSEAIIAPATGAFIHRPFAEQTGVFTATFDVKPSSAPSSGNIALSSGTPTAFSGMAVIIGFDSAGHFVVRNGGAYTYSTLILYQAGVTYHFRFEVNIPDHRYSVYVTPEGGTEQTLALDYAFRTEQNAVTELNTLTATAASPAGSWFELTNFMIGVPGTAPEITTTSLPEGTVGVPYSQTLTATGGDGELVWSIASGSLPTGLDLSGDGVISGTPLAAGSGTVVVRVADSDAHVGEDDEDTQALDWTIAPAAPVGVTITLSNLKQRYDGLPKPVTVTTDPGNVAVTVTYNGSEEPPVYPGTYDVVATVTAPGYTGSATAELEIGITALVRHGVTMSGEVDGSLQVLLPESTTLNGGAWISGDLLVSGRPGVTVNGNAAYVAVIDADGSATPTQHRVTLNSNTVVRYVVRQVDAIELPTVAAPPAPSGMRNVAINQAGQSIGDPATLRNLTINSKGGEVAVPPGTYGEFVANGQTAFVLGVAGSETPSVYNLQKLTLNSNSQIKIVGPVVLNVRETVMFNSADAATHNPAWLTVQIHTGGLTLNGNSNLNGEVVTPTGTVTLNGSSVIQGSVTADKLIINKQAALREPEL